MVNKPLTEEEIRNARVEAIEDKYNAPTDPEYDVIVSPPPKLEEMKYTRPPGWKWKSKSKEEARKDSKERTRRKTQTN